MTLEKKKTKPIPTRFPPDIVEQLQSISKDNNLPVSWIIRAAVGSYLKEVEKKRINLSTKRRAESFAVFDNLRCPQGAHDDSLGRERLPADWPLPIWVVFRGVLRHHALKFFPSVEAAPPSAQPRGVVG